MARILVLDGVRPDITSAVAEDGHDVFVAYNPEQGIAGLAQRPDMVICGRDLKYGTGYEFLAAMADRGIKPEVPIIGVEFPKNDISNLLKAGEPTETAVRFSRATGALTGRLPSWNAVPGYIQSRLHRPYGVEYTH